MVLRPISSCTVLRPTPAMKAAGEYVPPAMPGKPVYACLLHRCLKALAWLGELLPVTVQEHEFAAVALCASLEQGGNCDIIEFNMPDSVMFVSWNRDEPSSEVHILPVEVVLFSRSIGRIQCKAEFGNMVKIEFVGHSPEPLLLFSRRLRIRASSSRRLRTSLAGFVVALPFLMASRYESESTVR